MCSVGDLMRTALVKTEERKLGPQSDGLHAHSGIIDIRCCGDDEPRMAILHLLAFPHLPDLAHRRGFQRQRVRDEVGFHQLPEYAHLPFAELRSQGLLRGDRRTGRSSPDGLRRSGMSATA